MKHFTKLYTDFWINYDHQEIVKLGADAQLMALYLQGNAHYNILGVYYLPLLYIASDLKLSVKRVQTILNKLCRISYCKYDQKTQYVWVCNAAAEQIGADINAKDNRIKAIHAIWDALPSQLEFLEEIYNKYKTVFNLKSRTFVTTPVASGSDLDNKATITPSEGVLLPPSPPFEGGKEIFCSPFEVGGTPSKGWYGYANTLYKGVTTYPVTLKNSSYPAYTIYNGKSSLAIAPSKGLPTPFEAPSKGVGIPFEAPSDPLRSPFPGVGTPFEGSSETLRSNIEYRIKNRDNRNKNREKEIEEKKKEINSSKVLYTNIVAQARRCSKKSQKVFDETALGKTDGLVATATTSTSQETTTAQEPSNLATAIPSLIQTTAKLNPVAATEAKLQLLTNNADDFPAVPNTESPSFKASKANAESTTPTSQGDVNADPITTVFNHWRKVMEHPRSHLDPKRKALIRKALQFGYSVQQLCDAITGCWRTPHNIGQNEQGQRYDGLHVILRNADQIDRFIYNCHHPPKLRTQAEQRLQANLDVANTWVREKFNETKSNYV